MQPLEYWISKLHLNQNNLPNAQGAVDNDKLQQLLESVVTKTRDKMLEERQAWEDKYNPMLSEHLNRLEKLRGEHLQQLEFEFEDTPKAQDKKAQRRRAIDQMFNDYLKWIEDSMTTEKDPYIRIVAALKGGI
jgi:hypothetical protein